MLIESESGDTISNTGQSIVEERRKQDTLVEGLQRNNCPVLLSVVIRSMSDRQWQIFVLGRPLKDGE